MYLYILQHPAYTLNDCLTTTLPLLCQNQNVKIETKYTKSEKSINMLSDTDTKVGLGLVVKNDSPLPKASVSAGIGAEVGTEVNPNYAPIEKSFLLNFPVQAKSFEKITRVVKNGHLLEDSLHIKFTYETSALPERAGPAADAFLVPAMWFEVIKVWKVSYAGAPYCKILGEMDVALKANPELTGFSFTTANDIETRTLPLLTEQAAEINFKRTCQRGGNCCRVDETYGIDDVAMGCTASTLSLYCEWKDPGGIDECENFESETTAKILEAVISWNKALGRNYRNHERARNKKGSNAPVSYADTFSQMVSGMSPGTTIELRDAVPDLEDCKRMCLDYTTCKSIVYRQSTGRCAILGRDYSTGYQTATDDAMVARRVHPKVSLAPLTGLAPTILMNNARSNDDAANAVGWATETEHRHFMPAHDELENLKAEMKTWNMLEFAGGGSKMVFETNQFVTSPDPQELYKEGLKASPLPQRIIKDSSSSYQKDVDCDNVWQGVETAVGVTANILGALPNPFAGVAKSVKTAETISTYAGYIGLALSAAKTAVGSARKTNIAAECGREDKTFQVGLSSESDSPGVLMGITYNIKSKSSLSFELVTQSEAVLRTNEDDTSQARFTLQDDDSGDYFVISVWSDPDFGTPLFSLDGGASQCLWEVGTAHRSIPMLKAEYIGPEQIGPDDAALFKVNVGNGLSYYEAGISPTKFRPGWSMADGGYRFPDMDLALVKNSLTAGLTVEGGLGTYSNFGKGSFDILLKVRRGFLAFEYSPPVLTWTATCSHHLREGLQLGETSAPVSLSMPNPEQVVRFIAPCPEIVWSGKILADQQFAVLATGAQSVPAAVHVKGGTREIVRLGLQYRMVTGVNKRSAWEGMDTQAITSGAWTPTLLDGEYEIRAVAECTEEFSSKTYDTSKTSVVRGVFDRVAPELVSLTTASHSNALSPGDFITLKFSEDVVCRPLELDITVAFGTSSSYSLKSSQLKQTCTGSEVTVVLLDFTPDAAAEVAGEQITVSVSGLYDNGGNVATIAARPLRSGQAGLDRQAIARKADAMKVQIIDFNATLQDKLTAQFKGVDARLDAVGKNMSAERALITDHVDKKLDQVDKKLDEKLNAILQIVSDTKNGAAAGRFPVCEGPEMASFGRYVSGTVSSTFSEKAADVPKAFNCAKLCLDNDMCVAFGFSQSTFACVLGVADGSIDIGRVYTYARRFKFYNRLTSCSE